MNNENMPTEPEAQPERLITVLETLEKHLARQNSFKHVFAKGMVYGLGTMVGATVLVALFGGIIVTTLNTLTNSNLDENAFEKVIGR